MNISYRPGDTVEFMDLALKDKLSNKKNEEDT